jgi:hypothetical protein
MGLVNMENTVYYGENGEKPQLPPTPLNALAFKKAEKVKGKAAEGLGELGI